MAKVKEMASTITERASIIFKCIAVTSEATNVQNLLFMKKGDVYMEYAGKLPKTQVDYPHLRAAIEVDLAQAPSQTIERISVVKGEKKVKKVTVYPWGEMSIKMKAHSLAVSILKTYQRRMLKFGKDDKLVSITVFQEFDKKENVTVNRTLDIAKKTIYKSFDETRAIAFLDSFLKPAPAAKLVKKAA
jgi:hypothetical protein